MSSSSSKWFWGIFLSLVFIGLIFVGISFMFFASVLKQERTEYYSGGSGDKIGLIEINDVIINSEGVVQQIKKFREDYQAGLAIR